MLETRMAGIAVPGVALLGFVALLLSRRQADRESPTVSRELTGPPIDRGTAVRAARRLN